MAKALFEKHCRICLYQKGDMFNLFDEVEGYCGTLSEMIENCGDIKVFRDDDWPNIICEYCTKELLVAVKFKEKCKKSDEILTSLADKLSGTENFLDNPQTEADDHEQFKTEALEIDDNTTEHDACDDNELDATFNMIEINDIKIEESEVLEESNNDFTEIENVIENEEYENIENLQLDEQTNFSSTNQGYDDVEYLEGDNDVEYIFVSTEDNLIIDENKEQILSVDKENYKTLIKEKSENKKKRKKNNERKSKSSNIYNNCGICGAGFTHVINLKRHMTTVHQIDTHNLYSCPLCSQFYLDQTEFQNHIETHTLTTNSEENDTVLNKKIEILFDDDPDTNVSKKPFRCDTCDKRFISNSALISHVRIHTGEKPYKCNECSKRFTTLGGLDLHQKRHIGYKPFKCEYCDRRFVETSNLKVHMRTHTGEKPHICTLCGRGFSRVFLLQLHQRTHTGEKPYGCKICSKSFAQQCDLSAHTKIHTGERPHKCTICNKGFIKSSGLHCHMRRHNKIGHGKLKLNDINSSDELNEGSAEDDDDKRSTISENQNNMSYSSADSFKEEIV